MQKPKVICHMLSSIDGKATGNFLNHAQNSTNIYFKTHQSLNVSSFACGRVSMEESFTKGFYPNLDKYKGVLVPEGDYNSQVGIVNYAVAFDTMGKLGWTTSVIVDDDPGYNGKAIIEVLSEKAPKAYLAYLRSIEVSYIICGKEKIDLTLALKKLYYMFGIKTILLEGSPTINEAFLARGLIDEISLIVAPIIADKDSKPIFNNGSLTTFILESVKREQDTTKLYFIKKENYLFNKNYTVEKIINYFKQRKNILENAQEIKIEKESIMNRYFVNDIELDYDSMKNIYCLSLILSVIN